ncbi:MAG: M48 family metallopeptidase [Wenzhouxiangella sp.]
MNFFEHQDRARRQSRVLVFLFGLAVLAIVLAVNAVVLFTIGAAGPASDTNFFAANAGLIFGTTILTAATIGLASAYRSVQLRAGGGDIARALGGTAVDPSTTDPLRRRLYNVVEEMAIASGVPMPEVYVLEREQGINAFAAGYSPADAAVAVTRGTLEHLDRDELQGVIAHEFSHVFNGDMRLNIRLIGFLFGILVISLIGRRLLLSARYARDSRNAGPFIMIGLVVGLIGYVGLFFGRWIKAAVSRQREFLADASAVQFTRNPAGVSGALKKIGALYASSFMVSDSEEIGHMLFARGMGRQMFATHPPLDERIRAIDPHYRPEELKEIAKRLDRHAQARQAEAEQAAARSEAGRGPGGLPLNPDTLIEKIGQPGLTQVMIAAALAASLPRPLERAAHSDEWAQEVVCFLLLSPDPELRENQLLMIAQTLGSDSERQVGVLWQAGRDLEPAQRLPLLEMSFPGLRRRPHSELIRLMGLIEKLVAADDRVDVFEYCLARLTASQIQDAMQPQRVRSGGTRKLASLSDETLLVMAILAWHGHPDQADLAYAAFAAGLAELVPSVPARLAPLGAWQDDLDRALKRLDQLSPPEKQRLIAGLARCVLHDEQVLVEEMELLRVVCGLLHVPLPLLERQD